MSSCEYPDDVKPEQRDPRDLVPLSELLPKEIDFVKDNINFGDLFCRDCSTSFSMPFPNKKDEIVLCYCPKCRSEHVEKKYQFGNQTLKLEYKK